MNIDILNTEGKSTGRSIDLPAAVFEVEPNEHAVYLAVKQYLANQRQGTHKSKEKGEVKASTRKMKKQKGTGTARMGSLKSPLLRGGGRVFGPKPRNYSIKLNKKVKRLAKVSALSSSASSGKLCVIEDFTFDAPKTSSFASVVANLDATSSRTLFVLGDYDSNVYLSARNIKRAAVCKASDINTYDIMNAKKLVLSESAVKEISENLG